MPINKWPFVCLRLVLGGIFLWAFFDRLFGLGVATSADAAWLDGVSPTAGFLLHGTSGPLGPLFQALAGSAVVDWLFMVGLAGIGTALLLGIMIRVASLLGTVLLLLMYGAAFPPEHHPFLDEHLVYSLVLVLFMGLPVGEWFGLGLLWKKWVGEKAYRWLQ